MSSLRMRIHFLFLTSGDTATPCNALALGHIKPPDDNPCPQDLPSHSQHLRKPEGNGKDDEDSIHRRGHRVTDQPDAFARAHRFRCRGRDQGPPAA